MSEVNGYRIAPTSRALLRYVNQSERKLTDVLDKGYTFDAITNVKQSGFVKIGVNRDGDWVVFITNKGIAAMNSTDLFNVDYTDYDKTVMEIQSIDDEFFIVSIQDDMMENHFQLGLNDDTYDVTVSQVESLVSILDHHVKRMQTRKD